MPTILGARARRLRDVRHLQTPKGRRQSGRFAFEGPTLLREAHESGAAIEELYVTQAAYDASPLVRELEQGGVPTFVVDERTAAAISDLETPTGIVAVGPMRLQLLEELTARAVLLLVLADLNDPTNAGTLVRSADAFGCAGVVFGQLGVDPYHPKVVRGAMGALFRIPIAIANPDELAAAASAADLPVIGLAADGERLERFPARAALIVGHERHGLGRWEALCTGRIGIPMTGRAESLNAAIAGSIALYEAAKRARSTDTKT